MIMSTRLSNPKQKIMVCAPSNAAIDQIIIRIIEKGLIGLKGLKVKKTKEQKKNSDDSSEEELFEPDLAQNLIRITSAEYQTETAIKKYTLDHRIIKKLSIEKFGDLKKCIKDLKDMINEMGDFDAWDEFEEFPYVNPVKFKNYTNNLRTSGLRKVVNWGVQTLTRAQQETLMKQQLKIHEKELAEFKQGENIEQGNMEWKDAERAIIAESKIICCTLSMAGSTKLETFVN